MKKIHIKRKNQKQGFTLVETLCALAVLVLVIMAFTILIVSTGKLNINTAKRQKALDSVSQSVSSAEDDGTGSGTSVEFHVGGTSIDVSVRVQTIEDTKDKERVVLKKMIPD